MIDSKAHAFSIYSLPDDVFIEVLRTDLVFTGDTTMDVSSEKK